ncbi:hypothetical protein JAO76_05750 [Pontibacter sp. BT310]|jgi:hypothetical protein|uniref:Uncharacterized protein n=1 Tax=Pontibacter populi TaxID=890055 RepID=A0ABS6XBH9_9BACT|nr:MULTISPECIES: hypothetical protein [Pontibacter]MBJ6117683.1 hypothetical protein [Pontibacter sp. BT310]MBR0570109.1 hypothetical protein [Microvirga sp. STS03]MBW3364535.1 hypothetical protein [Pontibacter populi]
MKIPAIKKLVETQEVHALMAAEEAIIEEQPLAIEVDGDDEGEQLTHILAAIWILNHMQETGDDFKTSLREYTKKVRVSIS